jgi:hypothetical protein
MTTRWPRQRSPKPAAETDGGRKPERKGGWAVFDPGPAPDVIWRSEGLWRTGHVGGMDAAPFRMLVRIPV